MICSWIVNVIDSKLHTSTAYAETVYEMHENLLKRYAIANASKIHQLKMTSLLLSKEALTWWSSFPS